MDNVWLENGYHTKETAYGPATSIEDVDGLHQAIAVTLTEKPGKVTGKELRFLRLILGMSQAGLGKCMGATEQSVSLWERHGKVPKYADSITRLLVLDKVTGEGRATHIIDRINTVERLCNQRIVVRESRKKWRSELTAASDERFALAA
ncbi:MAG: transcriptional regulator [Proteobacteria bacterium]|nr:transcriptional regulator [Pseudomonadota bacterium]